MTDKTDRKLLEQALTTIEAAISTLEAANEQGKITDTIWVSEFETLFDFLGSEADALRAALAEDDVKQEIETALAPEQDPVAYVIRTINSKSISDEIAPTGWSTFESKMEKLRADPWVQNGIAEIVPLYTSPQQREWQGLTEKEVKKLADTHLVHQPESYEMSGVFDLIRAVAEKLEEKNT
jgi:hypothetical protein